MGWEAKLLSYLAVFLLGGWAGYVLKDVLTVEKETKVTINKPKIKGDGSSLQLDQDIEIETQEIKKTWRERWKERREKRKNKNNK